MRKLIGTLLASFLILSAFCQKTTTPNNKLITGVARPKLVVGIVIDQMRWDYIYRYNELFKSNGGFKRMLNDGFTCENTFIPYTPTVTAAGHTCVFTGSVPSIHGIMGNNWFDKLTGKDAYCTEDETVKSVGSSSTSSKMSPRNLLTTTIGDELRIATNFQSKVIGVAIKDRGAIIPAGHTANGAYWYDYKTGNFITSTYYMNDLPDWVKNFNSRKIVDSLYGQNWNLLLPKEVYSQYSTEDDEPYESKPFGNDSTVFPYDLSKFIGKDYSRIASTPYGNTLTVEIAKAAVLAEKLGKGTATDFLTVSFSSPDYIGHAFGPNSWEQLDNYVRLDETLGKFLDLLDETVGKNQYTVFLTADHGVAHAVGFDIQNKLPGGLFNDASVVKEMNSLLKEKYGKDNIIKELINYQIILNQPLIDSTEFLNKSDITEWVIGYLRYNPAVSNVFELDNLLLTPLTSKQKEMLTNGYYPTRSGDIQIILKPGYYEGDNTGTTHGLWNPYDSHIPLLFYGWGIKHGSTNRETYMTDIASTISALLHIQMPNGSIGHVIEEVLSK